MATIYDTKLAALANDDAAAAAELVRAKQVWAAKNAAGDKVGAKAAADWANQVRAANANVGGQITSKTDLAAAQGVAGSIGKPAAAAVSPYPALSNIKDFTGNIAELSAAQKASQMAALGQARDKSLSALGAESATIAPQYYASRNAAGAQSEVNKMNMGEFMAARGNVTSGAALQGEMSRQGALQGQVGALNQQEQAANADIARRTSGVQSDYAWGVQQSDAQIAAQQQQAMIAEMQRVQGLQINQANSDRTFNQGVTESDRTYELNKATTDANLASNTLDMEIKREQQRLMMDPNSVENRTKLLQLQSAQQALAQATELAKYAPQEAIARIAQIRASASASYASVNNMNADNARQDAAVGTTATTTDQNRLMNIWEAQGTAPAGITGVTPGTAWYEKPTAGTTVKPLARNDLYKNIDIYMNGIKDTNQNQVVPAAGGDYALQQLQDKVDSGEITVADAQWAMENVPGLKAYYEFITAKNRGSNPMPYNGGPLLYK